MQAAAGSRPVQALKGVRARLPAWRHKPAELAARAGSAIASRASSVRSALASAEARARVHGSCGTEVNLPLYLSPGLSGYRSRACHAQQEQRIPIPLPFSLPVFSACYVRASLAGWQES